jgi:hypothetical protein
MPVPGIETVRLDMSGWQEISRTAERIQARNENGEYLEIAVAGITPPEGYPKVPDLAALRDFYERSIAGQPVAVVDLDVLPIQGFHSVMRISKFRADNSLAMIYSGTLELSFSEFAYFITVQSLEQGTTGLREAMWAMMHKDEILQEASQPPTQVQSQEDLVALLKSGPVQRAPSDDKQFDEAFPDHPLTRVRRHMNWIAGKIAFAPEIMKTRSWWADSTQPEEKGGLLGQFLRKLTR